MFRVLSDAGIVLPLIELLEVMNLTIVLIHFTNNIAQIRSNVHDNMVQTEK